MKGIEYVNKQISNEKKLPPKLVEDVNKFYWREGVKKKLSKLEVNSLYIKNFLTISVSPFKIRKHILTTISKIRVLKGITKYKQETKDRKDRDYRIDLSNLLIRRNKLIHYQQNQRNEQSTGILEVNSNDGKES